MDNETISLDNKFKTAVEEIKALIETHKSTDTEYEAGTVKGLELALNAVESAANAE
ncbi:MAG: hypothetical protein NC218_03410 [Acetobacter sp.]|nr:hypothetical protein [Acetobacter sp.]